MPCILHLPNREDAVLLTDIKGEFSWNSEVYFVLRNKKGKPDKMQNWELLQSREEEGKADYSQLRNSHIRASAIWLPNLKDQPKKDMLGEKKIPIRQQPCNKDY